MKTDRMIISYFVISCMDVLNISSKKGFGIFYIMLKTLLVDLGLFLEILMKSCIPMKN